MRIIDRYMLRQFLSTFVICYVSLLGLYVVFDLFTNLEDFLAAAGDSGGVLQLITSFYSYQAVLFFDRTAGLLALVAAMFTITWIQRHNELTALMAAGIARTRVALPVVIAAIAITFVAAANRELVIPQFSEQLSRRPRDMKAEVGKDIVLKADAVTDILLDGEQAYADEQRIGHPHFSLPVPSSLDRYGQHLTAEDAYYKPPQGDRPGGYLLCGVSKPAELSEKESLTLDGKPVVIMPRDAPQWLEKDQCFVVSNVTFRQLAAGDSWREFASTSQLIAGLKNPSLDFGARIRVAIHSRIVQPLLDVTLLFLGLPLVLRRSTRNVFAAIGMCAAIVTLFMGVTIVCRHMGEVYWVPSASLAAWLPLFIFVPVATFMSEAMQR